MPIPLRPVPGDDNIFISKAFTKPVKAIAFILSQDWRLKNKP